MGVFCGCCLGPFRAWHATGTQLFTLFDKSTSANDTLSSLCLHVVSCGMIFVRLAHMTCVMCCFPAATYDFQCRNGLAFHSGTVVSLIAVRIPAPHPRLHIAVPVNDVSNPTLMPMWLADSSIENTCVLSPCTFVFVGFCAGTGRAQEPHKCLGRTIRLRKVVDHQLTTTGVV